MAKKKTVTKKATPAAATARRVKKGRGKAAAATTKPPPKRTGKKLLLDAPVTFGGVSIGETTTRLGLKVSRAVMKIDKADTLFVERRIDCKVVLGGNDEQSGQAKLMDDLNHEVGGSCDVKGFSVKGETFSTGLTFNLKDIDIEELAKFSKGTGRLLIEGVADIPDGTHDDDLDEEELGEE